MASTSSISGTSGNISFGGLASGLDTNSIVDKLVQLQTVPLTKLQDQQSACKTQISLLADLASRLDQLQTAASNLGSSGVLSFQATSSNDSFSATPGTGTSAGSFAVQVKALATAAKWRSAGLGPSDTLTSGTLNITVGGVVYPPVGAIAVDGSTTLDSLAAAIRATGAPVSATILDDGTKKYLSITNLVTGYTGAPDDPEAQGKALGIDFSQLGDGFFSAPTLDHKATNADFFVDGLEFTRTSNTISDAIPGTTLKLKSEKAAEETLSIGSDVSGTQANLQKFVDAFNGLMSALQKQTNIAPNTDRSTTLAGDINVRSLQERLQTITSSIVYGPGTVHSLADLGVKTSPDDGTLAIDPSALSAAIARDPVAVNAVFAQATTGIAQRVSNIATDYSSITGLLSTEQTSLKRKVSDMDDETAKIEARIDAYRAQLVAQYAAMENVVAKFKSIGDFLTAQDNANNKK